MSKTVDGIVRGPQPHFGKDGVLYAPGQIVRDVPADEVSDEPTREREIEVETRSGDIRTRKVKVANAFRPVGKSATVAGPLDTAEVATGQPDRLNVTDFLKQSGDAIVAAIVSGSVDDHLGAIEQAELSRKGPARKDVKDAISARLAASTR
jgi:hypothetical protein